MSYISGQIADVEKEIKEIQENIDAFQGLVNTAQERIDAEKAKDEDKQDKALIQRMERDQGDWKMAIGVGRTDRLKAVETLENLKKQKEEEEKASKK